MLRDLKILDVSAYFMLFFILAYIPSCYTYIYLDFKNSRNNIQNNRIVYCEVLNNLK